MAVFWKARRALQRSIYTLSQRIRNYPRESEIFLRTHGYPLNLRDPRSFTEKVVWKKIHDRNPLLPVVTDKLQVRAYVRKKLGDRISEKILIPLLYSSDDPSKIPFASLPQQFVIKSNHACNQVIFVKNKQELNQEEIIAKCRNWLSDTYVFGFYRHEWAYTKIKPRILVEQLLLDEKGKIPRDFKFYTFQGKCKRIVVCTDRYGDRKTTGYDKNWNLIDIATDAPSGPEVPKPENLNFMLEIAETLGKDFDFIRVDLYSSGNQVFFSELTSYPSSGDGVYIPTEYDYKMGSYWKIVPRYWEKGFEED